MVAGQLEPVALVRLGFTGRQDRFEVSVGIDLEFVDKGVGGRGHPVHRLQADVAGGAAIAEQSIGLAGTQARVHVHAVRALQAPGDDVVHAGAIDGENRVRVHPQRHVDSDREQHHQVAHAGGVVDPVLVDRRGHHELLGRGQPFLQVGPGRRELYVFATAPRQCGLRDRMREPGHRILHGLPSWLGLIHRSRFLQTSSIGQLKMMFSIACTEHHTRTDGLSMASALTDWSATAISGCNFRSGATGVAQRPAGGADYSASPRIGDPAGADDCHRCRAGCS